MIFLIAFALALVSVALDGWAVKGVLMSSADLHTKMWWVVSILLCPLIGALMWFCVGPKGGGVSRTFR